jgi:hypothetical protein
MSDNQTYQWRIAKGYAARHCLSCKIGWTRTGKDGGIITVCLLDMEQVLADMTDCDRFEPRDDLQG